MLAVNAMVKVTKCGKETKTGKGLMVVFDRSAPACVD